jgi:hypothetical protein
MVGQPEDRCSTYTFGQLVVSEEERLSIAVVNGIAMEVRERASTRCLA